jgi:hypothetical protein
MRFPSFNTVFLPILMMRAIHAVAQGEQHVMAQVEPPLSEGFTNHYTPKPESGNGPCDLIKDQAKMYTYCYLDEPNPKAKATIEDLKLCVADAYGNVAVQNM